MLKKQHPTILFTTMISLLLAISLAFDLLPFLRGGEIFSWMWMYTPAPLGRIAVFAVTIIIYIGLAFYVIRLGKARWTILWAMMGAAVIPLLIVWLRYDNPLLELWLRTMSPITTGPHTVAAMIDWRSDEWHVWTEMMREYQPVSGHIGLSPAGLPMIYGFFNSVFELMPGLSVSLQRMMMPYQCHNYTFLQFTPNEWASSVIGTLMPLWAGFSVIPLYAVTRRLYDDIAARWVSIWWVLVPSFVMFAPSWNTFYPLIALIAFWLLLIGIGTKNRFWALIICGVLSSLLIFANLSMVPIMGLFGFYTLFHYWFKERQSAEIHWTKPIIVGLWVGIGFFGVWVAYYLFSGLTPLDIIEVAFEYHFVLERDYLPAVWFHFWEWALLAGVPMILLWLMGSIRRQQGDDVLGLALLATMLMLLLSNTARGETGRVWLFFAAFAVISASGYLAKLSRNEKLSWQFGAITFAQVGLLIALAATWDVIGVPDLRVRPENPPIAENIIPQDAQFNESFRLIGWRADIEGDDIVLSLNWQSQTQMTTPYWFSALLVAPDGSVSGETMVWQPQETRYPTTCWLPETTIGDEIRIPLPENAPSGDWWLSLTSFADADNPSETLPVILPDGTTDHQLGLGPIPVE